MNAEAKLFAEFSKGRGRDDSQMAWMMKSGIAILDRRPLSLFLFADLCCRASSKSIAEGKMVMDLSPEAGGGLGILLIQNE